MVLKPKKKSHKYTHILSKLQKYVFYHYKEWERKLNSICFWKNYSISMETRHWRAQTTLKKKSFEPLWGTRGSCRIYIYLWGKLTLNFLSNIWYDCCTVSLCNPSWFVIPSHFVIHFLKIFVALCNPNPITICNPDLSCYVILI